MIEKRDVIRRLGLGHSVRTIQKETGVHRTVIRELRDLAKAHGWIGPEAVLPDEERIAVLLRETRGQASQHRLEPWRHEIERWLSEELSFVVIHRRLIENGIEVSEPTVRRFIHAELRKPEPRVKVPREHLIGNVMEVDFGYLGLSWDPKERRKRKTWVFSGRLRYSRQAWREVVFDQKASTFFDCHIHAFEHFGGVPASVVPDNLKAAVIAASFEDPVVNRAYQRLAEHYRFVINPCLPCHPRHKGGVESDIKYITNNFWKDFKSRQKEIGIEAPNSHDLQAALQEWSEVVAAVRVVGGVGSTVEELFEAERKCLQPLPLCRWTPVSWHQALVQETWRIQYRKAYYTVPYRFIGRTVTVMDHGKEIVIFHEGEEIARHRKAGKPWETASCASHQPPEAEAFLSCTRERIQALAETVGPAVTEVTALLLNRSVVDGLRPARALLSLRKTHGAAALERACRTALLYDCHEFRVIRTILKNGLDSASPTLPPRQERFVFAREPSYFALGAGGLS